MQMMTALTACLSRNGNGELDVATEVDVTSQQGETPDVTAEMDVTGETTTTDWALPPEWTLPVGLRRESNTAVQHPLALTIHTPIIVENHLLVMFLPLLHP